MLKKLAAQQDSRVYCAVYDHSTVSWSNCGCNRVPTAYSAATSHWPIRSRSGFPAAPDGSPRSINAYQTRWRPRPPSGGAAQLTTAVQCDGAGVGNRDRRHGDSMDARREGRHRRAPARADRARVAAAGRRDDRASLRGAGAVDYRRDRAAHTRGQGLSADTVPAVQRACRLPVQLQRRAGAIAGAEGLGDGCQVSGVWIVLAARPVGWLAQLPGCEALPAQCHPGGHL